MEENIFEKAIRRKLRFPFRGMITTEDLFDLTVNQLDTLHVSLTAGRAQTGESLIQRRNAESDEELRIDIVKQVFLIKRAEAAAAQSRVEKRERRQKIMAIIQEKKEGSLKEKSEEELMALLNQDDEE